MKIPIPNISDRIVGSSRKYQPRDGEGDHPYLKGYTVLVRTIHRRDPDDEDGGEIFSDDVELEAAGGLREGDFADVAPYLKEEGRWSFVTSDVDVRDLGLL